MRSQSEILREVIQGTNQALGLKYFQCLTRSLASAFETRYCLVTQCSLSHPGRVQTLAFWAGDDFIPNIEYDILATPCKKVILEGTSCVYGSNIQALFPDDQDLVDLGAESYAAVPMIGSAGSSVGHLVIMDTRPLDTSRTDPSILELFADRAAAELERTRASAELEQSEARLRQVIDLAPCFIFAKDSESRYILANQAVADAFGTTIQGIIGKSDWELASSPEEAESYRHDDQQVIDSGEAKVRFEETITDTTGRKRHLQTTKIRFHTGDTGQPAVLGVSMDVTEQRRAEEALRAVVKGTAATLGKAFFRSLAQHLALALNTQYAVVAEFHGQMVRTRAVWAGDQFLDGLEYALEGSPCERVAQRRETTAFPEALQELFRTHSLIAQMGAESYLGTPLFNVDREPIGLLAVLDQQPMGDQEQKARLLSIFASRAAAEMEREQLDEHRQRLQSQVLHVQKLESLGLLAGGIAHDFNNLLYAIMGNADLAQVRLEEGSYEKVDGHLEEILRASQRSADLTHQMLAYSGQGSFVVTRIDLNASIREMLDLLSVSISKKARIELDLASDLPTLEGDATQIRQILMNLVTNASDAIGDRPGTIRIRTGTREIGSEILADAYSTEQLPPGTYLFVEVEDDGCGMAPETLQRLFDPFFTTKTTGRGLGLAALLGITRSHQGTVRVQSREGEGSIFTILLPPSDNKLHGSAPQITEDAPDWRGEGLVLLADDEQIVRVITGEMLKQLGFQVVSVENGLRAVEVFRERHEKIRLVVLDMMMPELDGLEAFHQMKEIDPEVKVLLASGFSLQAIHQPESGGIDGFLQKPIRLDELQSELCRILG